MSNRNYLYRFLKLTLDPYLRQAYRFEVEGEENFPAVGPVIVVANHVSFMDSFWVPMCTSRRVVFLAKSEYFESWKTAWFFKSLGMIPIKRGVRHKADAALQAGVEHLESGGVLGMYPEGTRSPDGKLHRGRTGVARLALRSGAPVMPIGLIGSREVMPKDAKLPKVRGSITARLGTPMRFDKYAGQADDRLVIRAVTDEIMREIMTLSGQSYVDEYASIGRNGKGDAKGDTKNNDSDHSIPAEGSLG
ncbi:MAG: lysophospholipid acyltransferase family protein [Actinomycetota bacterium]